MEILLNILYHQYYINIGLKNIILDADYSIIEAKDKDLPEIIKKIKKENYSGINVTLPFKQKIINHIDKIVNDAELNWISKYSSFR